MLVAYLVQAGTSVVMFQPLGFEGSRREVLRWLSDGTRVHNVDWSINVEAGSGSTWIRPSNAFR